MDNAKRMILIEPEVIEKLKKANANNSVDNLSHLDEEMQKVLNSKINDREKWPLYLQTLQRYLYFIGKDREPIKIPILNNDISEYIKENEKIEQAIHKESIDKNIIHDKNKDIYVKSQLLQLLPKTYKLKGELLIDILLKNKDTIYWNDKGTVFINNKEVYKSNIVDLLNDVIRPLKNSSPVGWVDFASALKDLQVPLSYIGNPRRSTFLNVMSQSPHFGKRLETSESITNPIYSSPVSRQIPNKEDVSKRKIDWQKWTPY